MITGTVSPQYEMLILVPVRDSAGKDVDIETVLDTGFSGSLTLPTFLVTRLGLRWRARDRASLASGQVQQVDIYEATIIWDGAPRSVLVQAMDNVPLLGMEVLVGHNLAASVTIGGAVRIEAVP